MGSITKQAMYVLRDIEVLAWNNYCRGKAVSISYLFWVCFCSQGYSACTAHAPYCIIICGLPGYAIFFHVISQSARFSKKKKVIEHKMCVLIFSTTFISDISHGRRIERDMIINIYWSSCKVPIILVRFEYTLNFSTNFRKIIESNFTNIRSVAAELFCADGRTDRRTDMTKIIVAFRNFAKASKSRCNERRTYL